MYFLFIIRSKAQATDHEKAALRTQTHRSETARGECWQESVCISLPLLQGQHNGDGLVRIHPAVLQPRNNKQKNAFNRATKQIAREGYKNRVAID